MHRSSSRKRCFVLEGESEVLGVQAGAVRRGRPGVRGHRELNTAERVESCCGLEERLARKAGCATSGRGARPSPGPMGMKMRSLAASTLSRVQ